MWSHYDKWLVGKELKGIFLIIESFDHLPNFINFYNQQNRLTLNIQQIQEDLKQTFKSNMDQCFPGSGFLNFNYDNFEKSPNNNSKNRKLVYALLLTPDLKLISSLTLHFFRNDEILQSSTLQDVNQKYYIKIHNVCVSPNKTGTKFLMDYILRNYKPVAEVIWLNVLSTNERAYNLYLDLGFEFVFNNEYNTLDMIYNKDKNIISSRGNTGLQNIRKNIVNDMFSYKIYRNYINKVNNVPTFAILTKEYLYDQEQINIKSFINHIYRYLNPTIESDEMITEGYIPSIETYQPVLIFNRENQVNYLFLNSLVNNENISPELLQKYGEKLLDILYNKPNLNLTDLSILLRTQFPIITDVNIKNASTDNYEKINLNLNLFSVISDNQIRNYSYGTFEFPLTSDIYNINITKSENIMEIDLYVKYALQKGITKICVKISKDIIIDLKQLYYVFNLLPSYSASPYKENTFIYNPKRFNNINNTLFEFDNYNFNNLYVIPNATLEQQPFNKYELENISGCDLTKSVEEYYTDYINYLNFSTVSQYKFYDPPSGQAIILSFLGYLLLKCNDKFYKEMLIKFGLYDIQKDIIDISKINKFIQTIPFMTLNFFDYTHIKTGLLHNINIFYNTKLVNFISSNSHGSMTNINDIQDLEKGQKLVLFTKPNSYFYMSNLNYNFLSLIFDYNNIQRFFDCIDLLNDDKIPVNSYFEKYKDIISAMLSNNSRTDNDVIIYTQKYHNHNLEYNQEQVVWVNYPVSSHHFQHYIGDFLRLSPNQIKLDVSDIDSQKINTNYSLNGLFVNFNSDSNTTNTTVLQFDINTHVVTLSENVPLDATRVIIGNLPYTFLYPNITEFYRKLLKNGNFNGDLDYILDFCVREDNNKLRINPVYSKNFETNATIIDNLKSEIADKLLNDDTFKGFSEINDDEIRKLAAHIVWDKMMKYKEDTHVIPLSLRTNENTIIQNFIKTDTLNPFVKQYTTEESQILPLSYFIKKGFKHNSFICCRGLKYQIGMPVPKLDGEIILRELLNRKFPHYVPIKEEKKEEEELSDYEEDGEEELSDYEEDEEEELSDYEEDGEDELSDYEE